MGVFAHLSDLHIDGSQRSIDRATAVMDYLDRLPDDLDAVLVTGDIADHGLAAEYERARKLLSSRHRVLVCPGNHDKRAAFRQVLLGESAADGPINQAQRIATGLFALCDSSIPGPNGTRRDDGRLDDETIAWLRSTLDGTPDDMPVVVAFHHPPAVLHSPPADAVRQFGEDRLAQLITHHPNIAAILCGHAHTPAATSFAGKPLLVAPGVASTLRLPWEGADAHDGLDDRLPPAVAFHVLDDRGRLTTHYRLVT
jgi:3',5'-cyclic-AMP phosphodiesterase